MSPGLGACPRCESPVAPGQEYCLGCGSRLPLARGLVPALSGAWRDRLRWYPGDWVWSAVLLLAVAAVATTVALVATEEGASSAGGPLVATWDRPAPVTRSRPSAPARGEQPPAALTTGAATTRPKPPAKRTLVQWPAGRSAYTVVLASYPAPAGKPAATRAARKALRDGLPNVGVLDSGRYPSLHPGYHVVFSGVYESIDDAASALAQAQQLGYERAYTRQIVA